MGIPCRRPRPHPFPPPPHIANPLPDRPNAKCQTHVRHSPSFCQNHGAAAAVFGADITDHTPSEGTQSGMERNGPVRWAKPKTGPSVLKAAPLEGGSLLLNLQCGPQRPHIHTSLGNDGCVKFALTHPSGEGGGEGAICESE